MFQKQDAARGGGAEALTCTPFPRISRWPGRSHTVPRLGALLPRSQHTAVVLQHGDLLALSPGAGHPPAWQRASALLLQRTLWFGFVLKESSVCARTGQLHDGHQSTRNERGGRFMARGTRCPQHHCLCPSPVQLPLRSHVLAAGVRAPGGTRGPAAVGWERPPRNANQSSR